MRQIEQGSKRLAGVLDRRLSETDPGGNAARYKSGGARLAIALGVPIVPVAHNAGYLWPKGVLGKRSGTVTVSIGPPIRPEGKDMQRLTNEVETWIEDEVARLGNPLGETPVPHG